MAIVCDGAGQLPSFPEPHLVLLAGGLILQRVRPKPLSSVGRIRCVSWRCNSAGSRSESNDWGAAAAAGCPERPARSVTLGPYASAATPCTLGWTGIYLGMALVANTRWLISCSCRLLVLVHFTTLAEERELENCCGDNYRAYIRRVRRYL